MALSTDEFGYLRDMVLREAAIVLDSSKEYLAQSRLEPVAKKAGFTGGVPELIRALRSDATGRLRDQVVDAMTTNETLFFRDSHPFDTLRDLIIPELMQKRRATRTLDIWCAAASTGQEPYSILLLLQESFPELNSWRINFVGTDISPSALERARQGRYTQMEVNRGLPAKMLVKHFERAGLDWQINPEIQRRMQFKILNLASEWPPIGQFDLIFMRNVLIYFNQKTKGEIIERARRVLRPDGYFFLGSTESMLGVQTKFERVQHNKTVCYRPSA